MEKSNLSINGFEEEEGTENIIKISYLGVYFVILSGEMKLI